MNRFQPVQGAGHHNTFAVGLPFGPYPIGIRDMIQFRIEVEFLVGLLVIDECIQRSCQACYTRRDHVFDQRRSDECIERIASLRKDPLAGISGFAVVRYDRGG